MSDTVNNQVKALAHRLGVDALPVRDEQYVQVSRAAIQSDSVFGFRREADDGLFTGWEIFSTDEKLELAQNGYYSVRELAALRPEWLIALRLPVRWTFRFAGKTLIDGVSASGETIALNMQVQTP
jgi:hypothetical protein